MGVRKTFRMLTLTDRQWFPKLKKTGVYVCFNYNIDSRYMLFNTTYMLEVCCRWIPFRRKALRGTVTFAKWNTGETVTVLRPEKVYVLHELCNYAHLSFGVGTFGVTASRSIIQCFWDFWLKYWNAFGISLSSHLGMGKVFWLLTWMVWWVWGEHDLHM